MHSSLNIWRKNDAGAHHFIILMIIVLLFHDDDAHNLFDDISLLIGFDSCCKEDAQKCSCPFYSWSNVPTIGPISKGRLELRLH